MQVNIVCVGKIKEKYFSDAIGEYVKRSSRFCKINIIEIGETLFKKVPNQSEIQKILDSEAVQIRRYLSGFTVALDIMGKAVSSEELADILQEGLVKGASKCTFIIGSSYGLSDEIKNSVDIRISFGRVTYPHQLMRVILTEQIYRAFMIKEGASYHK